MRYIVAIALLILTACSSDDEQAVRLVATAELMQRQHEPQEHIEIRSVRRVTSTEALVEAKVLGHDGRASVPRRFCCRLSRDRGSWLVQDVEEK